MDDGRFKKGHKLFASLPLDVQESIRERSRRQWDAISAKERSRRATERNLRAWANRSVEARHKLGAAIRAGQRATITPEQRTEIARLGGIAVVRQRGTGYMGARVKRWWSTLTPEARAAFIASRAEKRHPARVEGRQQ